MPITAGIDVGTGCVKVVLFDVNGQEAVVGLGREPVGVALPDPLRAAPEPPRLARAHLEQHRLHAPGADVDARRDRHGASAYPAAARCAKAAAPRAPV